MADNDFPPAPALTDDRLALGRRLLDLTDELGLSAEGAAWVYDWTLQEWRYYLVTSLIDKKGAPWVYKRLLQAFKRLPEHEQFLSLDVHLGSPREILFRLISSMFTYRQDGWSTIGNITLQAEMEGITYSFLANLILYRMIEFLRPSLAESASKLFDRKVREMQAA